MSFNIGRRAFWAALAICVATISGQVTPAHAKDDGSDIDLKLFGTKDLPPNPTGCHFALWQANRNPASDKYAYLFFLPFSEDGAPLKARMKVGDEFIELYEIAQSQDETVGGLSRHYVYRSDNPRYRVLIELLKVGDGGSMAPVTEADIYVVRSKKIPFLAGAKGEYGCPDKGPMQLQAPAQAPAEDRSDASDGGNLPDMARWTGPTGIPLGPQHLLASPDEVPVPLRQALFKYAYQECDLAAPSAWNGASYVVNSNYILWELPCFTGAYQGSSAFGVTQNPPGDWANVLVLPNLPGNLSDETYGVMNAQVFNDKGLITATEFGRGLGDCGVYKVFRLTDGPGEELELELLEYREKIDCNGTANLPELWPLVFRSF